MTMNTLETKVVEPALPARPSDACRHLSIGAISRVAVLAALVILGQVIAPSFLSLANIHVILLAVAAIGIMAYGMTLVVITGEIDLSVAGAAILSCVVGGLLIPTGSAVLVIGATLLTGLVVGLMNGVLVAVLGIPSLIATLGMLGISRALANIASGGQALYPEAISAYLWFGRGNIAGIPVPVVLLVVLGVAAIALTKYSIFGRELYATGGNVRAAALSGINVVGVRTTVFIISGACAALAGMLESARLSYINPAGLEGMELSVLAVTVLGGAALAGGSGSIAGTLVAALIIGIVNNLLNQFGVSIYLQQVVTAAVILAVVLPGMRQRGIAK
ncbi:MULTISPECIES: ABC transporter permease [unclassified Mesorhizobium]|uniref:ABC transporter permease n=1 Tax=unclassified Mesorhizobium TaxID=325217 RepID=UPI0011261150|nr:MULTISPECIES: ABC transporter permease [unclassified Mesorhizobium]TPI52110.1 ABC transporter permease [Mesorhizobium sp. B3-1-1]TPJ60274.1 ABC transporter permease [Mesorhizobium sp. B2-6-1]TPJ60431.1 ABC transporter permease [Mesorhizobium sp. B2-6-7]TPJ97502.1 ABC transporter permease [Mesorhizobium sp. B2-5-10]TPK07251.1 ABC transporter permease [Mesorhizobium sp. B2-5-11]